MAEDSELETLARRYLDLWEGQLSAMAADSELAEQLGRLFAATNASLLAGVKAAEKAAQDAAAGPGDGDGSRHPTGAAGSAASEAGAPAAAAASGHGAVDLAELDRRIAAVERRLDALDRDRGQGGSGRD